ncbi:Na+/H+ antiporter NhaA [Olivibacter sp. XZL3]|uniref:Na+/H+ antiporter NhaA n=1 Tax=Olivibacter sp. XZL3 TaxID=1735116 RepID=UPI001065367C|nr:Na+/H+ antiporter NhaA [Olivibacter sp. XZL3]
MAKLINIKSFQEFLKSGTAGGVILILCVVLSLIIANSPWGDALDDFLAINIGYHSETVHLDYPIIIWINDGLMAIFFLLVGLEIKRELVEGELASVKRATLPVIAALGGVIVPALIYTFFNKDSEFAGGWGIPMATDIAFALAIITLLGNNVPPSLKIFLAALAIVDDLMAILVIAIFYSTSLQYQYLLYAGLLFALLLVFNRLGVKRIVFYIVPGIFIWYFIHHSGIHATIAGVLTAFTLPTTPDDSESPLEKLEHMLVKPVNFLIMPIFALANTNIRYETGMLAGLATPLGLGIALGLFLGKPIGITFFSWLAVKLKISNRPHGASWKHILGVGMLGGIGFTMSIFIAILSFADATHVLAEAKFSILIGSLLSGIAGSVLLLLANKSTKKNY